MSVSYSDSIHLEQNYVEMTKQMALQVRLFQGNSIIVAFAHFMWQADRMHSI